LSAFIERVRSLVRNGDVRISEHGYDELAEEGLTVRELVAGVEKGVVVGEHVNYPRGPSILLLQKARKNEPIYVVWSIPKGRDKPVVPLTVYRPDPVRWDIYA